MAKSRKRNLQLLIAAWSILKSNKKLFIFPLMSLSFFLITLAIILTPFAPYRHSTQPLTTPQLQHLIIPYLIFLIFLSVAHFIMLFFNSAMIASTQNYFRSKKATIKHGLQAATHTFARLARWNLFASTIGIFIFLFPQTAKKIKWIEKLLSNQRWGIASYFVMPFLVVKNKSALNSLQASSSLLQQTWGNELYANFRFSGLILLIRFVFLIPALVGLYMGTHSTIIIGSTTTIVAYFCISVANIGIKTILCSALFFYAIEKKPPVPFDEQALKRAFIPRDISNKSEIPE